MEDMIRRIKFSPLSIGVARDISYRLPPASLELAIRKLFASSRGIRVLLTPPRPVGSQEGTDITDICQYCIGLPTPANPYPPAAPTPPPRMIGSKLMTYLEPSLVIGISIMSKWIISNILDERRCDRLAQDSLFCCCSTAYPTCMPDNKALPAFSS
ncbi:hypothetical protein AAEP93_010819 [Penicillium crustosum]